VGALFAFYALYFATQKDASIAGWVVPVFVVAVAALVVALISRSKPSSRRPTRYKVLAVVACVVFILSLAFPAFGPAWVRALTLDHTSPAESSCSVSGHDPIIREWTIKDSKTHVALVDARLMRSKSCGTSWVRAIALQKNVKLTKEIRRPASGALWSSGWDVVADPATDLWTYGDQVYAPGCVDTRVIATRGQTVIVTSTALCK
jgi:amino acid transporter